MVASNLHPSFANTGHLAISAAMEYKIKHMGLETCLWCGGSVNHSDRFTSVLFKDFSSTDSYQSFVVVFRTRCGDAGDFEFLIDFLYLSVQFRGDVMNCKWGEGLRWYDYGRTVMAPWRYHHPPACSYFSLANMERLDQVSTWQLMPKLRTALHTASDWGI